MVYCLYIQANVVAYCMANSLLGKKKRKTTSKLHDFIKEFNAIGRVRDWPVAHPQDTRSTLSLSPMLTAFGVMHVFVGFLLCSHKTTLKLQKGKVVFLHV